MTEPSATPTTYQDRIGGLIASGVVLIVMGLLCLLIFGFSTLSTKLAAQQAGAASEVSAPTMTMVLAIYGGLAVTFLWLGVGCILARRWARALTLVVSVIWLICGTSGMALATMVAVPALKGFDAGSAAMGRVLTILAVMGFIKLLFYVAVPLALFLFIRSPHVKATCEARDPVARWTDRCPLPVLGAVVAMVLTAANTLTVFAFSFAPLFGRLVTGTPAFILQLGTGALLVVAAVQLYRLRMTGWWLACALLLFWCISAIVTFQMVNVEEWMEAMRLPPESRAMMPWFGRYFSQMGAWTAIWSCAAAAYLMYIKRFLQEPDPVSAA